jgi:hypothetical protein
MFDAEARLGVEANVRSIGLFTLNAGRPDDVRGKERRRRREEQRGHDDLKTPRRPGNTI